MYKCKVCGSEWRVPECKDCGGETYLIGGVQIEEGKQSPSRNSSLKAPLQQKNSRNS